VVIAYSKEPIPNSNASVETLKILELKVLELIALELQAKVLREMLSASVLVSSLEVTHLFVKLVTNQQKKEISKLLLFSCLSTVELKV